MPDDEPFCIAFEGPTEPLATFRRFLAEIATAKGLDALTTEQIGRLVSDPYQKTSCVPFFHPLFPPGNRPLRREFALFWNTRCAKPLGFSNVSRKER
jgi:hypothetical protein